jgi:hypothetical protein
MTLVFSTENTIKLPWLCVEPSTKASGSSCSPCVTPPLVPHIGCYQIPFPLNLCNTRNEKKRESIAKSGSTSLERSITRGGMEFIQDIKDR